MDDKEKIVEEADIRAMDFYKFINDRLPSVKKIFDRQRYWSCFAVGNLSVIAVGYVFTIIPNFIAALLLGTAAACLFHHTMEVMIGHLLHGRKEK